MVLVCQILFRVVPLIIAEEVEVAAIVGQAKRQERLLSEAVLALRVVQGTMELMGQEVEEVRLAIAVTRQNILVKAVQA